MRVVSAVVPVASLWIAKLIIDRVAAAAGHPEPMTKTLWALVVAEFTLATLATLCSRGVEFCETRIAEEFSREVSQKVIRHATGMDLALFEDSGFQDLLERARMQATDRADMLGDLGRFVQQTVALVSLSTAAAVLSPWLLLLVVCCVFPTFLAESHYAFANYALSRELTPQRRELDYLRQLCTSSASIKEVKLFQLAEFLEKRFIDITRDLIRRSARVARRRWVAGSVFAVVGSIGYYGAYAILVASALRGNITVGTLTFLTGALLSSSASIQLLLSLSSKIADQFLFLNDLFAFLDTRPAESPVPAEEPAPTKLFRVPAKSGIEFRDVSFSYPGTDRPILRKVSFKVEPKERIALVGANGQGKTTLVKLLARLYEPTAGAIYVDGVNLREYDLEDLWARMGVIFQDFGRYEMTAAENIAIGRISERANLGRLREAARASGADEILAKLPNGFDQLLGRRFEGGVDISGGEWQRLAIARAYLRQAGILVLDEPTAALDARAEHEVYNRFADLATDHIVLLISHRFSTVRIAHRILVLDDGVIREEGTHEDLLARRGLYADMFELQAANYR
ncbi:MAG TPA: ABC transporter ATP-binding protein [Bryobacteraceae bacterium]|nr:ABC transporter ATP-binding protein [Bryobacteraceae bacterium]